MRAALDGTSEVMNAVFTSVLTIICIFYFTICRWGNGNDGNGI